MNDTTPFVDAPSISERFLLGDLIKHLVRELKDAAVPFAMMPENNQQELINRITDRTREAVRQAVKIIAARGVTAISGEVTGVKFAGGIQATVAIAKDDANRLALADSIGSGALIVLPEYAAFLGGEGPKPDPDQPELLD